MNPRALKPTLVPGNEHSVPAPSLRSLVRKSALLNAVIVLTSFPVLVFAGGPNAVVPAAAIMGGITYLIWTVTFTVYFVISLPRLFRAPFFSRSRRDRIQPANAAGVADPWLDDPF